MRTVNVFADTAIVNRLLDIENQRPHDQKWEENREYLSKIVNEYVGKGIVQLFVNPSVKRELERTRKDPERKKQLLNIFELFIFLPEHKTVFPIILSNEHPASFLSEEGKRVLENLYRDIPSFRKDEKIFADALFNSRVECLLTTDEEHLANDRFRSRLEDVGLGEKIKVFTPKEFYDYLKCEGFNS
ncbi:hypothetical protein ACFLXF_02405 [Chloroflexota bacterium]